MRDLLHKLKIKGAPNWSKSQGKQPETKKQDKNEKLPLQDTSQQSSGLPSYKSSISNIASEINNPHQTQGPYDDNQGMEMYPTIIPNPNPEGFNEYSGAPTMRFRKISVGEDSQNQKKNIDSHDEK